MREDRTGEQGYSVVEALVGLVILFIVLIPATQLVSYLLTRPQNQDKIYAINLAEKTLENTLLQKAFYNAEDDVTINNRTYSVSQTIQQVDGKLLLIVVEVKRKGKEKLLLKLYCLQLVE
ncbi:MAG: hypothetical protein KDH97_09175 [Calditrichaeota bacterium]|nr:hypothetical protein [Calditrichota bacterium]MCB0290413.1 hypothetical protein [Calditrichota bacterium]MCB0294006.1 hypothetical protein [Calditrichota bacterium]MCB0303404.1 hypothetical protein [Calditrichota bacterium]MCB0315334.1 hypothetical protein [Calditrichota bacterium]